MSMLSSSSSLLPIVSFVLLRPRPSSSPSVVFFFLRISHDSSNLRCGFFLLSRSFAFLSSDALLRILSFVLTHDDGGEAEAHESEDWDWDGGTVSFFSSGMAVALVGSGDFGTGGLGTVVAFGTTGVGGTLRSVAGGWLCRDCECVGSGFGVGCNWTTNSLNALSSLGTHCSIRLRPSMSMVKVAKLKLSSTMQCGSF